MANTGPSSRGIRVGSRSHPQFADAASTSNAAYTANYDAASAAQKAVKDGMIELTKNDKYCVSKFPATPPVLRNYSELVSGLTDQYTCFALTISTKGAHVWDYSVPDRVPQMYFFPPPASETPSRLPLLGALISPIAGSKEPGLVLVSPDTGVVSCWEGVGGAIANDLLHKKKNITHNIKLYASETIEIIQNVEPAGIVASTSSGRLILLTFRDSTGKPRLNSETMRGSNKGFLASLKGAVSLASSRRGVVSIKNGKSSGRDERQVILITDQGNLIIWDCYRTGQERLLYEESLKEVMLNGISALYPHAAETFTVHDVEYHEEEELVYVLTSFVNNPTVDEIFYVLFTLSLEQDVLQVVSTHRFQTYTSLSSCRPQLFLPKPYGTLFVLFSQAVILIDSLPDKADLGVSRRWEDIITLTENVEAFAFGKVDAMENNQKIVRHSGVIVMTKGSGLLRVERFKDVPKDTQIKAQILEPELAKTRIEQAVFYGYKDNSSPLNFDSRKEFQFTPEVLEKAFLEVSYEILSSTSPYFPPILPSLADHLLLRWEHMGHLVVYLQNNFPNVLSKKAKLQLLANIEKLYAAKALWAEYDKAITTSPDNDHALATVVSESAQSNDPLRTWFTLHAENLETLLVEVAKYAKHRNTSLDKIEEVNGILLTALPEGALQIRHELMKQLIDLSPEDYTLIPPWAGTRSLIEAYESQYEITTKRLSTVKKQDRFYGSLASQLVQIVSTLCELYTERIRWCSAEDTEAAKHEGQELTQFYRERRGTWMHTLVTCGHKDEARRIAEVYEIYRTLVEILVDDLSAEQNAGNGTTVVAIGLVEKLREYILAFDYDFAKELYQYYIETKQLKSLLKQFPEFNEYIEKFFESGNYGRISWIHDLSTGKYQKAAQVLANVSATQEGSIANKRLELSIAKLSVFASGETTGSATILKERIDAQMEMVNIQEAVLAQVKPHVVNKEIFIDQVSSRLQELALSNLISTLQRALTRLVSKNNISVEELIDILTLIDTESKGSELNFYYALKLLTLPTTKLSESRILLNQQLIWRRLYLKDE